MPAHVAMVGTFDLENLGDLLFPIVAHHELTRRLGDVELELFSYRAVDPPSWPLKVRPVHTLGPRMGEFDLVLVGGGHLVRGDADVAPGYGPTDGATPHPFGLWLVPTLQAAACGVPIAWNALGVLDSVPSSLAPLVDAALSAVDHLAVRDLEAARFVRTRSATAQPVLVPDTVFGIEAVLDDDARGRAAACLQALGVEGRYVVVQPSALLEDHCLAVDDVASRAVAAGMSVVELACGPCHHDAPGRLSLRTQTVAVTPWPEPLVAAAILSGAEAVVAASLHAGVISLAAGVPLARPRAAPRSKHEVLEAFPGVTVLPRDEDEPEGAPACASAPREDVELSFGRRQVSSQVVADLAVLDHHWSEVAALARTARRHPPSPAVTKLLTQLPGELVARDAAAAARLEVLAAEHAAEWRTLEAALEAALEVATAAQGSLGAQVAELTVERDALASELDRPIVRLARRLADALDALRTQRPPGSVGSRR